MEMKRSVNSVEANSNDLNSVEANSNDLNSVEVVVVVIHNQDGLIHNHYAVIDNQDAVGRM